MKAGAFSVKHIAAGLSFAILWASASTATKIGLSYAQPFVISIFRFFLGGLIMLFLTHIIMRQRLPKRSEWKKISIYGALNISIYLGLYILGMQQAAAGIGSLFIASNPVLISLISAVWLKQPLRRNTVLSLFICSTGILIASYPLMQTSYVTPAGLILLFVSMLSYSVSAIYFSKQNWQDLHILTINGWQTLIGGALLLPLFLLTYEKAANEFSTEMIASVFWLAIPVSIGAIQLWMHLLKKDAVKASFWLFLCPVFGFIIAAIVIGEPINIYTVAGVALVIGGLWLVQKNRKT